jgi:hypothetical protein
VALETRQETITPQKAYQYLETMDGNRAVRQSKVDQYEQMMRRGLWRLTHQGIAFHKDGRLVDGQHRLWALIAAGLTIKMMVSYGLTDEDVLALDGGLARDYADNAHYQGWDGDRMVQPILKWLVQGTAERSHPVPSAIVHKWYEFHQKAVEYAMEVQRTARPNKKRLTAPACAGIAKAFYEVDKELLDRFFETLRTGQLQFETDSAATVFRDAMLSGRLGGPADQHFKIQGAIRAFSERRSIKTLQRPEQDCFNAPKLPKELRYERVNVRETTSKKRLEEKVKELRAA